jgi:hypothetical protein
MLRRSLLKTLPIGVVAPYLAPLVARAEAETQGRKPMRFIFMLEGNGLDPVQIQPVGIPRREMPNMRNPGGQVKQSAEDALVDLKLTAPGQSLSEAIAPLTRHMRRLTVLQGLSGRVCGGGHGNGFGALGAYAAAAGPKDITIDAALARANPSIYRHVALGINSSGKEQIIYACSASGPNQKIPHFQDPALAYRMLFGRILGGNTKAEIGTQTMLLDFMAEDIHRLERQLPGEEAQKLQQFADSFSVIAKRQSRLSEVDPKRIPPQHDDVYLSELETKRLEAQFDIAATALIAGLTNTVTLACDSQNYVTFKGLGISVDKHTIGHRQVEGALAMEFKIRRFYTELLAKLVDQLEAIPEGDGSMMDNTLIVYLSDSAEQHHSTCYEWPMLLIGNLGGRLKTGDRYFCVPKYGEKGHATVARFYTTLLHAAGAPVDQFGTKDQNLDTAVDQRGPLEELLA